MMAFLTACQAVGPKPSEQRVLGSMPKESGVSAPLVGTLNELVGPTNGSIAAIRGDLSPQLGQGDSTAVATRGTLEDTIALTGQVVAGRTAQLTFGTAGTIQAVHVRSGQTVQQGTPLVELALDDNALLAAQTQATVAELAYKSQEARVAELRRGGGGMAVEEARAGVARARAALLEAELAREAASNRPASVDVQLARLAVEQANDDLAQAQAAAQRTQETEGDQSALAMRSAERKVKEATIRLDLLRARQAAAPAALETERQRAQLQFDQAKDDLASAQAAAQQTEQDAQRAAADAAAAVRVAERQLAAAMLRLTPTAAGSPDSERQLARLDLDQARADVGSAQARLRRIEEEAGVRPPAQPLVQVPSGTPTPTPVTDTLAPDDQCIRGAAFACTAQTRADAISALRAAERRAAEASLRLEQLNAPATPGTAGGATSGGQSVAAQAQLQVERAQEELARAKEAEQRTAEDAQRRSAAAARAVRSAERRVADLTLMLNQTAAGGQTAADAELQLAELALAQANDEQAQAQAAAQLAARQQSESAQASSSASASSVRAAERKLTEATLKLQQARTTVDGAQPGSAAQHEVPDLKVSAARAELAAAEARLAEVQNGTASPENLQNEEQRLALLKNQALAARNAAQPHVVLNAPFDGTITSVGVLANQSIDARTPVVRIDDPSNLSVMASASEYEVSRLAMNQRVEVSFPSATTGVVIGTISDVGAAATRQADKASFPSFPVRIDLPNMPDAVRLGMTATINVSIRGSANGISIPSRAIHTLGGRTLVTRVTEAGGKEEVPVVVGNTFGTKVEILSGLREGDIVDVTPAQAQANIQDVAGVYAASASQRRP